MQLAYGLSMNTLPSIKSLSRCLVVASLVLLPSAALAAERSQRPRITTNGSEDGKTGPFVGHRRVEDPESGTVTKIVGAFSNTRNRRDTFGLGLERNTRLVGNGKESDVTLHAGPVRLGGRRYERQHERPRGLGHALWGEVSAGPMGSVAAMAARDSGEKGTFVEVRGNVPDRRSPRLFRFVTVLGGRKGLPSAVRPIVPSNPPKTNR